ncbi:MAG TPA: SMC-Scp complex subunit ScpB [bacterium]|nr:SMC-Scp complex subunit ScpB [bacterium]
MLKSQVETLLFVSGAPLSFERLLEFLEADEHELKNVLVELESEYSADSGKGFFLLRKDYDDEFLREYQFVTPEANQEIVKTFLKWNESLDLSKTAIEALTIIAYRGPLERTALDYIRGVNSRQIVNQLIAKGLVQEVKPDVFEVTIRFLRLLGLGAVQNLPNYQELNKFELKMAGEIDPLSVGTEKQDPATNDQASLPDNDNKE